MLEIREISTDKKRYLDLLLIGDEQEDMIDRYLDDSTLFVGFVDGQLCACCAVVCLADGVVEIKNLAVLAQYRRKGVGRTMLKFVKGKYPQAVFQLGTGETPSTLRFYRQCGYEPAYKVPNFFIDNYDHPIVEEGVRLKDMIYLRKSPETLQQR